MIERNYFILRFIRITTLVTCNVIFQREHYMPRKSFITIWARKTLLHVFYKKSK